MMFSILLVNIYLDLLHCDHNNNNTSRFYIWWAVYSDTFFLAPAQKRK